MPFAHIKRCFNARLIALWGMILLLSFNAGSQTLYDWQTTAPDGNWKQGTTNGPRWNPGGLWDEPPSSSGTRLRFNNNTFPTMTNNVAAGYIIGQLFFGSSATTARNIGGNSIQFFEFGSTWPRIENQSTTLHTINFPFAASTNSGFNMELVASSGNLDFGSSAAINTNGRNIQIYGNNTALDATNRAIRLGGIVSGTGLLNVSQFGVVKLNAGHTYTGQTQIDNGDIWIESSGSIAAGSGIFVGNGGQVANVARFWLSNGSGGTTFSNNITINNGNANTRFLGGLNSSGTHTFSGNITNNSTSGGLNLSALTSGGTTALSGIISGSSALITEGSGTLTLSGTSANTYTGTTTLGASLTVLNKTAGVAAIPTTTTINAGVTVRTDAANQWGTGTPPLVTINGTGILNLNGNNQKIALSSASSTSSVTLGSATLNIDNTGTDTYAGTISGTGGVTKTNTGTQILSNTGNSFTGPVTLGGGTLSISADNNLGTAPGSPTAGQIAFTSSSFLQTTGTFTLNANRGISLSNSSITARIVTDPSTTLTYGGIITGGSNPTLAKQGTGTLILTGSNAFSSPMSLQAGITRFQNSNAAGTASGGVSVSNGAALELQSNIAVGTEALTLNGNGISAGGVLRNISGNNSWDGGITLQTNPVRINADAGSLTLSGSITNSTIGLTLGGSSDIFISGIIGNGSGTVTKDGSGTLTLSGANTYTGNTTIINGTLQLGAANTIPNASNIVLSGGTLRTGATAGFNETTGTIALTASSTIALGTGSHQLTFANSSLVSWTGTLSITGWTGAVGTSGTNGQIFVGVGGLTAAQLLQVSFSGFTSGGQILATGELVPAALPSVSSFSGSPGAASSGYIGSTITITGSNFIGVTDVRANGVTVGTWNVVNSTTITFTTTTSTTGLISVVNPVGTGTSVSSYTSLGYITNTGATDWSTAASWLGNAVPPTGANVTIDHNLNLSTNVATPPATITINAAKALTVNNASGTITATTLVTNNGTLSFSNTGSISTPVFNNTSTATISWAAAGTLNISAGGTLTNSGTFTAGNGTVSFAGTATITSGLTFNNITALATVTAVGLDLNNGLVNGILEMQEGRFISTATNTFGPSSILRFNRTTAYGVGNGDNTWRIGSGNNVPQNIEIAAGGATINEARVVKGDLTITGGTFTLAAGLSVNGNWNRTGGSFVPGTQTVSFIGNASSGISATGGASYYNLTISKTSPGAVSLSSAAIVSNVLTLTSGIVTTSTTNTLTLASNAAGAVSGGGSTSYINGPLDRTVTNNGTYVFPVGAGGTYLPFTLAASASGNIGTLRTQAFVGASGGAADGTTITSISSTEYWTMAGISGGTSNGAISIGRQTAVGTFNTIASSATPGGSFTNIGGTASGNNVNNSNIIVLQGAFIMAAAVPAPTITSVVPASPIFAGQANTTGYSGQTITINGTNFVNSGMLVSINSVAAAVSFISNTQLTVVVANTGVSANSLNLTVTNSNSGTSATINTFSFLGHITASGATDWSTGSSWLGTVVPSAAATVTIAHNLTIASTVANSPASVTVNNSVVLDVSTPAGALSATSVTNNGTVTFSSTGSLSANTFTNAGTLSWTAAGTLNITALGFLTNNGTFTRGTGTVNFLGAGTVNGSSVVTFNNINVNTGTVTLATGTRVDGTLAINGGNIGNTGASPIYTTNSTLQYNVGYTRFLEWSANGIGTIGTTPGYPNNVTVNSGTFTVLNADAGTARALNGNLQVNTGATFTTGALNAILTVGGNLTTSGTGSVNLSSTNQSMVVKGSISNGGTLTLSSTAGGDLEVGGDFTNSGTFTHVNRAVTFNGTAAQAIAGSFNNASGNATNRFPFLTISNTAPYPAGVSSAVSVNAGLNGSASFTISAGSLYEQTANTFTLVSGATANVNGYLRNSVATITNSGTLNFNSGSFYEHNYLTTAGTIPSATWNTGSTCSIIGYTSFTGSANTSYNQTFSNFTWNCPNQTVACNVQFNNITPPVINGNFSVVNTGSGLLRLSSSGTYAFTVNGNLIVNSTLGNANLDITSGGTSANVNVLGNVSIVQPANTATLQRSGGTGAINFVKGGGGTQTFSSNGTISGGITWNAGDGSTTNTVQLTSNINLGNSSSASLNVLNGAKLDFQNFQLQGTNVLFTANTGSTLITANTDASGALSTSGATGSVRTTGTRTFTNVGINYTFNAAIAQNTGNAVGAAPNIGTLTVSNSNHVTLGASTTVSSTVALSSGRLKLGANNLTMPSSGAISNIGTSTFIETDGTGELRIPVVTGSTLLFPVGRSTPSVQYMPASFTFTASTPSPNNLAVRAVTPRNTNDITATDYINNRWWYTNMDSTYGEYAYSAQYTYAAADVVGTIGNIKLNRWNGSSWLGITGSSASGTTLSSGNVTDGDGNLANAQWVGRVITPASIYSWNNPAGGSWTTNTNWTPNGVPGSGDEVTFSGTSAFTVSNVPTGITLNKLTISGSVNVTWQPATAGTVNIGNGTSPQFTMAAGTTLTLDGTASATALNLNVLAGNSAQIDGTLILRRGAQRFTANTAASVQFRNGGRFVAGQTGESPTYSGNPFGTTGTANVMVFQNGSVYEAFAGANPFGLTQPASRVVFQTGSLYKHSSNLVISSLGRTYANFEYSQNSSSPSLSSSTAPMIVDNLTVTQGVLNLDLAGTPGHAIRGAITIATGATLSIAPATAGGTINLSGTTTQTISGPGNFITGTNSVLNVSNSSSGGVAVEKNMTIGGSLNVASAGVLNIKNENIISGAGTFNANGGSTLGIGSAAGITTASNASGNIQTTTRNYNGGANYVYNGSGNQATGNGLPATVTGALTIANGGTSANTVTLSNTGTTVSTLNLNSGLLACGSGQTLNIASGGTIDIPASGNAGAQATGSTAGTINFVGTGNVNARQTGLPSLTNVVVNATSVSFSGGFSSNATITNQLELRAGSNVSNAPFYAVGSTLVYNTGGPYTRQVEWGTLSGAGYPHHVRIQGGTSVNANLGALPVASLNLGGNLDLGTTGSAGSLNMASGTKPLNVAGNITIGSNSGTSTLTLGGISGSNAGDLIVQGNWTRTANGTFVPNNREVVFSGSNAQTLTAPGAGETFDFLAIDKTGSQELTLMSPAAVNQRLRLTNGLLTTSATNLLTLTLGATFTGGSNSSYVNGPLARVVNGTTDFVFPVGSSAAASNPYQPAYILPASSTATTFTASYVAANPAADYNHPFLGSGGQLNAIAKNSYWLFDRPAGSANARVGLVYPGLTNAADWVLDGGSSSPTFIPSNTNVAIAHNNGSSWNLTKSSGNYQVLTPPYEARYYTDNGVIYSNVMSSFSPFTFGYSYDVILPVNLISFTGRLVQGDGRLNWKVADAKDLAGFEVEYSTDGRTYNRLATIAANGGTEYSYLHKGLAAGEHYYRLLVKDKSSKNFYSQVVLLTTGAPATHIVGLKQNPVRESITPIIVSASAQNAKATITDAVGRLITTETTNLLIGQNQWRINAARVHLPGLYFITIQTADGVHATYKFVK